MNDDVRTDFAETNFFMQHMTTEEGAYLIIMGRYDKDEVKVDTVQSTLCSIDFSTIKLEHNKKIYKFPSGFIYQGPAGDAATWSFGCYVTLIPGTNLEYLKWKYEHPNR